MNQRAVGKSGARRTSSSVGSKSVGSGTHKNKAESKGQNSLTESVNTDLMKPSEPEMFFTYKSADDKNVLAIIDAVRTGISYDDFERIVSKAPFSLTEWATYLQLSERTIQRSQKGNKPFQPIQSEKIIELVMLYEYGVEVFGDKEHFNVWLNSLSVALGGRTPKELLDTQFGVGMVKDGLGRIEHGVLA